MKNRLIRRVHVFFSSLFIFLLHLPFVFATVNPAINIQNNNAAQLQPVEKIIAETISSEDFAVKKNIYDSLKLDAIGLRKEIGRAHV